MVVRLFGRVVRIDKPVPFPSRWDGSPQAHPVTLKATFAQFARRVGETSRDLGRLIG